MLKNTIKFFTSQTEPPEEMPKASKRVKDQNKLQKFSPDSEPGPRGSSKSEEETEEQEDAEEKVILDTIYLIIDYN